MSFRQNKAMRAAFRFRPGLLSRGDCFGIILAAVCLCIQLGAPVFAMPQDTGPQIEGRDGAKASPNAVQPNRNAPNGDGLGIWPLDKNDKRRMRGSSWHANCPVPLQDLVKVNVIHHDFSGEKRVGQLVVHHAVAKEIQEIFAEVWAAGFPIAQIKPIAEYGGSDDASMAANNTSAFNCRPVTGRRGGFSAHSYGTAVDINPLVNPYVRHDQILPPQGRMYLNRSDIRQGMVAKGDVCHVAFEKRNWNWGGNFRSVRDYQHFEKKNFSKKVKVRSRKASKKKYNHKGKKLPSPVLPPKASKKRK